MELSDCKILESDLWRCHGWLGTLRVLGTTVRLLLLPLGDRPNS